MSASVGLLKKANGPVASSNNRFIELMSIVMGTTCIGLAIILIVLKEDNHTSVGRWPWSLVVIPAMVMAFFFLLVWTFVHYYEVGKDLDVHWTYELARQTLTTADVDSIEVYHERYVFRDLLMVFSLLVLTIFCIMVDAVPCPRTCTTPFTMFGTSMIVINVLRIISICARGYFDFIRLRELAQEVRHYKAWRDERRFRDNVVPSIIPRFRVSPYAVIEACLFVGAIAFLAIATLWVEGGACVRSCPRAHSLTSHTVVGMYVIEAIYFLSVVALAFFRRSLGLEKVESLVQWIHSDRAWKTELLDKKYVN